MQMYPDWSSRANTNRTKKRKRKQDTNSDPGGTRNASLHTFFFTTSPITSRSPQYPVSSKPRFLNRHFFLSPTLLPPLSNILYTVIIILIYWFSFITHYIIILIYFYIYIYLYITYTYYTLYIMLHVSPRFGVLGRYVYLLYCYYSHILHILYTYQYRIKIHQ